jgi:enamine deaminase RidA (YjgF/YER057c/UK114 family)
VHRNTLVRLHPLTGAPIAPLGYRKDGRAIWPILGGSEPAGEPAPDNGAPPAQDAQDASGQGGQPAPFQWDGNVESLPADVQKVIRDARDDAAKARTNAKAQAADQARQELAQQIGKALGLVTDGDTPPDPAQLTEQLTAAQQAQRETALKLAVFQSAATAGADPARLLDSNSFLASVRDIDPADGEAVTAAITKAVTDNAWLKAGRAPGASGADHAGGSGEGAVTSEQFARMSPSQRQELYETNPTLYRQLAGR